MTLSAIKRELSQLRNHPEPDENTATVAASLLQDAYEIAIETGIDFRHVGQLCTPAQALLEVNKLIAATPLDFLNVSQAAKLLGVNSSKVLSWIRSGKLPAIDSATGTRSAYRSYGTHRPGASREPAQCRCCQTLR